MTYLKNHQVFASNDLHGLREVLTDFNELDEIDVIGRGAELDAAVHAVSFSGLNLLHASYGDVRVQVQAPESDVDALFLVIPTQGGATAHHKGQDYVISNDTGLMRDMRVPISAHEAQFSCLGLTLPVGALKQHAHTLIGPAASVVELDFNTGLDLSTPGGRHVIDTLDYVANALDGPLRNLDNPIVLDGFKDILLSNILTLLPNSYTDLLHEKPPSAAVPYYVKRARDYIHAHADTSITLEKLVHHAGCGYRTLQTAFNDAYGMPPMAYVKSVRLTYAHNALLNAEDGVTVYSVATKWGFAHMGRFAESYAKQFGVLPANTLRSRK